MGHRRSGEIQVLVDPNFRSMAKAYYKGAVVVLLVYDVTSEESFHSLRLWHQEASNISFAI